ncbi:MAG TPA: MATE family efflux transporter, partial [Paracoccaceae bacterium]|nr:MATE family efflux transporter [Paracoccaceae bacterium]
MGAAPMSGARFTSGSTMRHVAVMAATGSAGLLALFLVDALNLFYISLLGITELAAAIGFAGTIQFFIVSVSIGIMIGGSTNISHEIGAGGRERAQSLAGSALLTAALLMTIGGALVWIWRREALMLLGAEGAALDAASDFIAITLISMPMLGISMGCSGTLRAIGAARQAMWVTLSGGMLAAMLDPLLIFGFGLELTGAAISMVTTRTVMAGIGLWFVIHGHRMAVWPRFSEWISDLRPLLAVALPAIATQLSTPFGNAYLTSTVAEYGDGAVAGWAVVGRLSALAFGGIFALAGAVGPIVGQNYGAWLPLRIRTTYRDALLFVLAYVAVAWVVLWFSLDPIVAGFGLDEAGAGVVAAFVHGGAGAFIFTGALFVSNAAFNNLGRPIWSTGFNWTRDALAIPGLALLLGPVLGLAGAVWIQALAAILVGSLAAIAGWATITRLDAAGDRRGQIAPATLPPYCS